METRCRAVVNRFRRRDMQLLLSTGVCLCVSNGTMTTTCRPNKLPPSLRTEQCPRCSAARVLRECGMWYLERNANELSGGRRQVSVE